MQSAKPHGIWLLECIRNMVFSLRTYQTIVLAVTFFAYAGYHATRKIPIIVKNVLHLDTKILGFSPWLRIPFHNPGILNGPAPFDGSDGTALLGQIDLAFLSAYSSGIYCAGHLNLRILLTVGMVGTGLFTALYGVGYWLNIHGFSFCLVVGWPSLVAVVGNWFGKRKRGLIMGIWNAHTSIGNISGSLIAAALLKYGWGWSFAGSWPSYGFSWADSIPVLAC